MLKSNQENFTEFSCFIRGCDNNISVPIPEITNKELYGVIVDEFYYLPLQGMNSSTDTVGNLSIIPNPYPILIYNQYTRGMMQIDE